jgi:hypothetical protein
MMLAQVDISMYATSARLHYRSSKSTPLVFANDQMQKQMSIPK